MLVRFTCEAHGDVIMFGDIAKRLLSMMGHSGTIPSAIATEDVPAVLERLKQALESVRETVVEEEPDTDEEQVKEPPISISVRAFPLIELLTAAAKEECSVMWYEE